ncbi:MAG: DUF2797 domain-containing protein [Leptospira sp.]|nr:DUF2797 domain-containing protein [Leptospira sp.]
MMSKSLDAKGLVQYEYRFVSYKDEDKGEKPGKSEEIIQKGPKLNDCLGKNIELKFTGSIRCVDCGRPTKKSFNQGSCYVCFTKLASNDLCIMQPTRCHYHKGTCREPEWGEKNCFQNHTVYLSLTSGAKVGITKEKNPVNRWIDQGATLAIPLLETTSRIEAGIIEAYIGKFIPDSTSWQKMVTSNADATNIDFSFEREKFLKAIQSANLDYPDETSQKQQVRMKPSKTKPTTIEYPVLEFPKAKSIKVEPGKTIQGILKGIKGQYLLLDVGVINLRTYQGYKMDLVL